MKKLKLRKIKPKTQEKNHLKRKTIKSRKSNQKKNSHGGYLLQLKMIYSALLQNP